MSANTDSTTSEPGLLWAAAASVAAFGSWMLFDALPGINWALWTGAAAAGLALFARQRGGGRQSALIMGGVATVIAGAAAVTDNQPLTALICLAVALFLSMQMLVAAAPSLRSVTLWFAATAPFVALRIAAVQTLHHGTEATHHIRSARTRAWVRGLAITLPVLVVFALLLANADPIFAASRDAIASLFASWEFVPRTVFFGVLLVVVLGAYGYASAGPETAPAGQGDTHSRWLTATERLLLLGGVAALLWLFLALQLGYLFGNLPSTPASGMTFAEYARRGFGELTFVASASALLIVGSERYGSDERKGVLRLVTFAVIAAVLLLLGSAFRRVLLYEAAYGFTTARLYAQVYMCAVAAALVMLSLEVAGDFDAGRLFRRAGAAATILFIALAYWNHEAWIARQNMDRYASTGKLDVAYLTGSLSPDAIPSIGERLPSFPEPLRSEIRDAVRKRYPGHDMGRQRAWYEWNLASTRARQAVESSFALP
ncbi:MAG: DUF4173 domain-containing protein [Gemmatimonadaceae bacterium]